MSKELKIGLVGFGCVGEGLYRVLNQSKLVDASISRIVVKNKNKVRSIDRSHFSWDKSVILDDPSINVVVELINDSEEAYIIVKTALQRGKHVVTANKKLIAEHLPELQALAAKHQVSLLYEAAVAAAIPIIRNLEEYYNNDTLTSLQGIVNGTTNYILTRANEGVAYADALEKAQASGFAELNPTMDVDAFDSRFKLTILLKHAFGLDVKPTRISHTGIRNIKPEDATYAREKGYKVKLVAHAERVENEVVAYVAPQFVPAGHALYQVDEEFNAVVVEGAFADKQLFYGKGAGSYPTASAVLSDISALKFDYRYEFKKSHEANAIRFNDDFYLKIYLGSRFIELINEVPFLRVDEVFQSKAYSYQTGWVHLRELNKFQFNSIPDLSLIVLPESLVTGKQLEQLEVEGVAFSVEF